MNSCVYTVARQAAVSYLEGAGHGNRVNEFTDY